MEEHIAAFEKLEELLKLEREADFEYFKKMVQSLPIEERINKGFCWHPVNILKTGYTLGDRAYIVLERTKQLDQPHKFRAGKVVNFFTARPRIFHPERSGVIDYIDKHKMKIILNTEDPPNWTIHECGVELLFDSRTYEEMRKALDKVKNAKGDRLAELRAVLLGKQPPQLSSFAGFRSSELNESQNNAISNILSSRDVSVIHGPPGTGKTTTLVYAIQELCKTEKTVLVTAPSNTAVDLLTERLANIGLNVVRIGNISRVDESLLNHTLEVRVSKHPDNRHIKKVRLQAAENRRQAWRLRRKYYREQQAQRRAYLKEARELSNWATQLEERLLDQILNGAQVITCTLVGSVHPVLSGMKFRTVVIDEAAQALEPATWIPITRASKVVLVGDPFQLPPTIKSSGAKKGGFDVTLIEKSLLSMPSVNFLDTQYRMNEQIMQFSNQRFYDGVLKAADSVKSHRLAIKDNRPVEYIDTVGCGFDERINPEYKSRYNPDEFQILCEHLYLLLEETAEDQPSIAIISPYREQVIHMSKIVREDPKLKDAHLTIDTIDGFQGQERDVVYISLVRSNRKGEIGFLKDYRRMNVAMTRARKKLVVVGDSATIGGDPFYNDFLSFCEEIGAYRTAWELMVQNEW